MVLSGSQLDKESLLLEETLFHTANGYLGVRGNFEEGSDDAESVRGFYVNGLYDTVGLEYPERLYGFAQTAQRMVNLPDIQTMKVFLDGVELNPLKSRPIGYSRSLDMEKGISERCIRYAHASGAIAVTVTRMASFTHPELFLTVMEVVSEGAAGKLEIHAGVDCDVSNYANMNDPRVAADAARHICFSGSQLFEDGGLVRCSIPGSGLNFVIVQRFAGNGFSIEPGAHDNGFDVRLTSELTAGASIIVEKITTISDSRRRGDPAKHAIETADQCVQAGSRTLLCEQKSYLESFWKVAAIDVEGFPEIQDALRFSMYELLQSVGRDGMTAVSAKGLSGEGYEGHYFWDTEIYIFPFFLLTHPDIAKGLLDFRYSTLESARGHALLMGHSRGALYPWRTIAGGECSAYYPSGSAQYHINGDVAHSFMQYWYATGDLDYMALKGAEVLVETARLWLEAGHYGSDGKFLIHAVTGPDEYTCIVNNNYYTNRCAAANLRGAAELCGVLWREGKADVVESATGITSDEADAFMRAADAMWFPYNVELDIHEQDDSFLRKPVWDLDKTPPERFPLLLHYHPLYLYRHQVCKQADTVLAHFLFGDGVKESTMLNSYEYYERITTHDSSLSRCIFSIMASRLGMADKAYAYFTDTLRTDLDNTHGNTRDGLHTANLGGSWLSLVMGFAGLRLREDGLHFRPALPSHWERAVFRLRYRGRLIRVQMEREQTEFLLEEGEGFPIFVNGRSHMLENKMARIV